MTESKFHAALALTPEDSTQVNVNQDNKLGSQIFFDVYGPFDLYHLKREVLSSQKSLWIDVEDTLEGLSGGIGCYLFGIRHGEKITPWYVGMTVAQGGFCREVFQPHKIEMYNWSLSQQTGAPVMFLFPLMTPEKIRLSRAFTRKPVIAWLEKTLMALALQRNSGLANTRDMTLPRSVVVRGVLGKQLPGKPNAAAREIRKVLPR